MGGGRKETLDFQMRYFVDRAKFPTREAAEAAVEKAKDKFRDTGRSIAGVRIEARWRNPDRKSAHAARWKTTEERGQTLHAFWKTIYKKVGR